MNSGHAIRGVAALRVSLLVSIVLVAASCATVSVRKLTPDRNSTVGPEGIRFYRPRPYVAVHEPFPIFAKVYLASGRLTPDGKYVAISSIPADLNAALGNRIQTIGDQQLLESRSVLLSGGSGPQGLTDYLKAAGSAAAGATTQPATPPAEPQATTKPAADKVGQTQIRVTNDNFAFAVHPMRRYFDVVYLPDFDEDYVVHVEPGLGNANVAINMGQGWSLQGMNANLDNDAVVKRVFQFYDDSYKLLSGLAKTALGLPPIPGGTPQGLTTGTSRPTVETLAGGTIVSLRVTRVRMASPGLYPILKPAELQELERKLSNNGGGLSSDQKAELADMVVPIAPMTNIGFHTFEALIIEAVPADGDSAYRITQYGGGTVPPLGSVPIPPGSGTNQAQGHVVSPAELESHLMDWAKTKTIPLGSVTATSMVTGANQVYQLEFQAAEGKQLTDQNKKDLVDEANGYLVTNQSKLRAQLAP
jgi:hypothetical protein